MDGRTNLKDGQKYLITSSGGQQWTPTAPRVYQLDPHRPSTEQLTVWTAAVGLQQGALPGVLARPQPGLPVSQMLALPPPLPPLCAAPWVCYDALCGSNIQKMGAAAASGDTGVGVNGMILYARGGSS